MSIVASDKVKKEQIDRIGDDAFARAGREFPVWLRQLEREWNREVDTIHQAHNLAYASMLQAARTLYGSQHRVVRYLQREAPRRGTIARAVNALEKRYWRWQEREDERQRRRQYEQRRKQTNQMLQDAGYIPHEHYRPTAAIGFAREVINPTDPHVRMLPEGEQDE